MSTTVKTQAQAVNEIRNAIIEFELNGDIEATLKTSVAHSISDIQVRDFVMGITYENHSTKLVLNFLNCVVEVATLDESVAINAVRSAYLYRLGDEKGAQLALDKVAEINPNYSLATLLRRVMGSGWSPEAFEAMTRELHPKVVSGIEESECELLINFDR